MRYGAIAAISSGLVERDEESVVGALEGMPAEEAAKILSMGALPVRNYRGKLRFAIRSWRMELSLRQLTPSSAWEAGAEMLISELRQSDVERARQWEAAVQAFRKQQSNDR